MEEIGKNIITMDNAIISFFTSPVDLPKESEGQEVSSLWWEPRNGYLYPWRITGNRQGYPCGEPKKVE
jgi:hypothetical protein